MTWTVALYGQDGELLASGKELKPANLGGILFWRVEPEILAAGQPVVFINPTFVAKIVRKE